MNISNQLRPAQAASTLGVSVSTLWAWAKTRSDFPQPRRLSARCTVFDAVELAIYVKTKLATPSTVGQRLVAGRKDAAIRKAAAQ